MSFSTRILPGLALLLAAAAAVGQAVDHYEVAPSVMRANGQSIYPAGVSDPSLVNPAGPPPESAIPPPPAAGLPVGPTIGPPAGTTPVGTTPVGTTPVGPMPVGPPVWSWPASAVSSASGPVGPTPVGPPVWSPSGPASPNNSLPGTASGGPWSSPAPAQTQVYPSATAAPQAEPATQASWYTRVEYFHWNERIGGQDFVTESGALFTLGYSRQIGIERFRGELFGGEVNYQGFDQVQTSPTAEVLIPLTSNTDYLGLRGEYEMVLAPAAWEGRFALLIGLGTRFWIRGFPDGTDAQGNTVPSIQETWWTIYPYLGLETHHRLGDGLELYSESRVGTTAVTYQYSSTDTNPLWPKPGIMANTEIGLRGPRFFVAARAEVMSWSPSSVVELMNQPNSVMYTLGGRLGFTF